MEMSILNDCEAEDKEVSYIDVPEFVTNIKEEIISTEEPTFADSIQNKEEYLSRAEGQLLYSSNFCSEDHVKIEPADNEKNVDEFHDAEEMLLHIQDAEASVSSENVGNDKANTLSGKSIFKCDKCYYETHNENNFERHTLLAKHVSHECSICGYKTTKIGNYKRHLISHESKEGYVHKCLECQFQITDEFAIYKHMAEHSSPNNGEQTACQQCDHGTFDTLFGSQMLTIESEVKEFYYQKCQKEDKVHVFSNESITEVNIYKCSECKYQTKRKGNLAHHMLRHKNPNELEMFGCTECSYQSFNKSHLQTHSLTHKDGSEVTMYKCAQCEYHSKYKADLRVHVLRHKNRSEVPMFKCTECTYQAIRKCDLNRHLLRHKSATEVRMHRCPECKYQTFDKGNLNKHIFRHSLANKVSVK